MRKFGFVNPINFDALYQEAGLMKQIRFSLRIVILANICNKIFTLLTTGTALTGYAGALGADNLKYGLLTAIPFLSTMLQIPISIWVSKSGKRKRLMVTFGLISRFIWLLIGAVPFVFPISEREMMLYTVIFLVGVSSVGNAFYGVCFNDWLADLVPVSIRGRWLTTRDRLIIIINLVFSLGIARLLDTVSGLQGYGVLFIIAGILGVIDMGSYIFVQDFPKKSGVDLRFSASLRRMKGDKRFVRFIIFWTVWLLSSYMSSPYTTYYALYELQLTFTDVTLYGTVLGGLVTILVITMWGRLIDRRGNRYTLFVTGIGTAISPIFLAFADQSSGLACFVLYNAIGAAFWEVPYLVSNNIVMTNSPAEYRPAYIAIFSCVSAICGSFVGTMFGGALLNAVPVLLESHPIPWLGGEMDPYQFLFIMSTLVRLAVVMLMVPRLDDGADVEKA